MKICLVIRSNKGSDINNFFDVSALREASIRNGHELYTIDPKDLIFTFNNNKLAIKTDTGLDILDFDSYILRLTYIKDGFKIQSDKLTIAQYLISHNKFVLNFAETMRFSSRSKIYDFYRLNKFNIPLIPTIYVESSDTDISIQFLEKYNIDYPLILKSNKGLQGKNLFKINNKLELESLLKKSDHISYLIQPYFEILHDLRILVLGGVVLGAMDKIHTEDNFKGNISQGAIGERFTLSPDLENLAKKAATADGSDFVGVDIAVTDRGFFVLEVNRAPGFEGFSSYLNIDVGERIIKFIESKV